MPILLLGVGLLPAVAGATALGDFRRDIRLYRDGVEEILQKRQQRRGFFLESVKKEAEYLAAYARGVPPEPESLDKEIVDFSRFRQMGQAQLPPGEGAPEPSGRDGEEQLWSLLVEPYLGESYLRRLVLERALLDRREYDPDFAPSANFIERLINDHVDFLQYRNERKWYRQQGISRLEANVGLEPFVLLEDDNPIGVMAHIGLLHHFFPDLRQSGTNRYLAETLHDGWWDRQLTRHLRKVGFRVGAGALFDGPTVAYGAGLRLRSITVWGIYSSGETEYSLAIGFSDFEWLKKINFVAPF